jgi:peptide/nickel transport system permease protein
MTRFRRSPAVWVALGWLTALVLVTVLARLIAPFNPLAQNLGSLLQEPSGTHLLGTDSLGRDILSRLMYGGGSILWGAAEATAIALAIGVPAGLAAGYLGGAWDAVISWFCDLSFAVPAFVVLVAVAVLYQGNTAVLMAVLGVLMAGAVTRLVRNSSRVVRDELFVDAARVSGLRRRSIIARHILPSVTAPVVMLSATNAAIAVTLLTALAFLGLGGSPETPNWGTMMAEASQNISTDPWLMVSPGAVLILTIISLNIIANSVRDALPGSRPAVRSVRRPAALPAVTSSNLLDVCSLVVGFGSQPVVDGVSLHIAAGQTLGVVGESGSGKTVTALSVLGLLPAPGQVMSGGVYLRGQPLTGLPERRLRRIRGRSIAYVTQEPMAALDPSFTIGSQLVEALRHFGTPRRAVAGRSRSLLADVGISDPDRVARCFPHQISGGMAQRVAIALALTGNPSLIIADEPTTALDVTVQAAILDLFRSLDVALLLVTHDLGVVADVCDTVAVMYAGQVVEQGPTSAVLSSPRHPYTAALLGSLVSVSGSGRRAGQLRVIEGSVPAPGSWPAGCRFAARCPLVASECLSGAVPLVSLDSRATRCLRSALVTGSLV